MTTHPQSVARLSVPQNIDALIQQINAEIQQESQKDAGVHLGLLRTYQKRARFLRSQTIQKIEERIKAGDVEPRLKAQIAELSMRKAIASAERWIRSIFLKTREKANEGERQTLRVLKILSDLDDGRTNTVQKGSESEGPIGATQNGDGQVGQALVAGIGALHESERHQDLRQRQQSRHVEGALGRQQGALRGQLDAIKNSKLFGVLFQIFKIISASVLSVVTAGIASPAVAALTQTLYDGLMRFLNLLGRNHFQNKMETQGRYAENAADDYQALIRQIVRDEADMKRTTSGTRSLVKNLEEAHLNR